VLQKENKMSNRFKPKFNIKKGDLVIVISGASKPRKDDSGKIQYKPRKVLEVFPDKERVLVEGANIVTRHTKPSARDTKGGIVKREASIHISNVMLWDAKSGAPSKVKRTRENGKLVRVSKKSGEIIK
jgi:large subunit ribosomal protein L24